MKSVRIAELKSRLSEHLFYLDKKRAGVDRDRKPIGHLSNKVESVWISNNQIHRMKVFCLARDQFRHTSLLSFSPCVVERSSKCAFIIHSQVLLVIVNLGNMDPFFGQYPLKRFAPRTTISPGSVPGEPPTSSSWSSSSRTGSPDASIRRSSTPGIARPIEPGLTVPLASVLVSTGAVSVRPYP